MKHMLADYYDLQVCELLDYGFPIGFEGSVENLFSQKQFWKCTNHKGATEFPVDINLYIQKESKYSAILGPFKNNPFNSKLVISPLNTVPKKSLVKEESLWILAFQKEMQSMIMFPKMNIKERKHKLFFRKLMIMLNLSRQRVKGVYCLNVIKNAPIGKSVSIQKIGR